MQALCRPLREMGMENVEITLRTGNLRSNRIPQRLGFGSTESKYGRDSLPTGSSIDLNVYLLER